MAFVDAPPSRGSAFHRILNKIIDVKPSEVPALAWAWLYIFSLLSSYYIMRPIRDQMGVAGGVNNLQWLFTGTLIGMLLLNLPFSYLVKTFPRQQFITISYRFFSANILLFALAVHRRPARLSFLLPKLQHRVAFHLLLDPLLQRHQRELQDLHALNHARRKELPHLLPHRS